jgi:peptide/nickel transport system permease protein
MTRAQGAGAAIIAMIVGFGLLGPLLVSADPARQALSASLAAPGEMGFLLGADQYGRSMLSRLAHGARLSLTFAFVAALTAAVPGTLLGLLAAWHGGWVDRAIGLFAEAVLALPGLLLVLLLLAFAPGNVLALYCGIALVLWVEFFRLTRAAAAGVLARPQVEAARMLGFGPAYILRVHVWPEIAPLLATLVAFAMGAAVLAVASLSAISVGLRPPTPEWGAMTVELLAHYHEAPVQLLLPAICVALTVLGFQLLAAGRR